MYIHYKRKYFCPRIMRKITTKGFKYKRTADKSLSVETHPINVKFDTLKFLIFNGRDLDKKSH